MRRTAGTVVTAERRRLLGYGIILLGVVYGGIIRWMGMCGSGVRIRGIEGLITGTSEVI
jgi:hypothetical protein